MKKREADLPTRKAFESTFLKHQFIVVSNAELIYSVSNINLVNKKLLVEIAFACDKEMPC